MIQYNSLINIVCKNYALNYVKATSADKGAVRNRDLLDGLVEK